MATIPTSERFESHARLAEDLVIDPSLSIYEPTGAEVDPVTYTVVANKLSQINDEAAATVRKVSGSIIVTEAYDFNCALADPRGDLFALGAYLTVHGTAVQRLTQWTLENRSANPGIKDGDAFLVNDPWIGAAHQNDTALLRPVFVDGKLFAWTASTLHFVDLGGKYPSSFVPDAEDVFSESLPMPPVKYLEGGEVRADIEDMFLRRSRMPLSVGLDLKALTASTGVARRRILELVEHYGADVVANVMRRILDDTEKRLRARLRDMPDGTWKHVHQYECSGDGDRGLYRLPMTMTKTGDHLHFDLTGADEQRGFFNCTEALSESSIIAAVLPLLCHDLPWATGAVLRVLSFAFTPGTIIASEFPAASGGGVTQTGWTSINSATAVLAKMMTAAAQEHRDNLLSVSTCGWIAQVMGGIDRNGAPTLALSLDQAAGGIGARTWADGDDTAGMPLSPGCQIANVESQEMYQPLLWLYRRILPDSGGAGQYRGGNGGVSAVIPHGTPVPMFAQCFTSGLATPNGAGVCGGAPARTGYYKVVRDSDFKSWLGRGAFPAHEDDLAGTVEWLPAKKVMVPIGLDDVFAIAWFGGGGFGDPLDRDPAAVLNDVQEGMVSAARALDVYGVELADNGTSYDEAGTIETRARMRGDRVGSRPLKAPPAPSLPTGHRWFDANLTLSDGETIHCGRCERQIAEAGEPYKGGLRVRESRLVDTELVWRDPADYVDDVDMVYREFICPGCGALLETELSSASDMPLDDKRLAPLR